MFAELALDEQSRLSAVRATFVMDETESLYIASSFELDPDGPWTPEQGQVIFKAYAKGYAPLGWFTHLSQGGEKLEITRPSRGSAQIKDLMIHLTWELPLAEPASLDAAPILLQFYDPSFDAETFAPEAPKLVGPGAERCAVAVTPFEPDAGSQRLRLALSELPRGVTPEDPTVGRLFADRIEVRCADGPKPG